MNLTLSPAIEQYVDRFGGRRRVMIAAVGLGTVLLILGLSRWATAPTYVPVFTGLPLETVGQVTDRLTEESIPFKLESNGQQILVRSDDVARTRVMMAQEGLPASGRPGMELFDQPSWGMTDFAQRINYRRALEGELERTVGKMRGVESAQVHLAMDENRAFLADTRPTEASVVLKLTSGRQPESDVVSGIQHLVASSVDGLLSANVTVVDESGKLLSVPNEPGSLAALTSRQLGVQRETEAYLQAKVEQLVAQIVGAENAQVRVSADLNFDRVERTTETVDPEMQVIATEQRSEIIPGAEGGAGSTTSSAAYENSRQMEVFAGATGTLKRLSVAVLVNDRMVAGEEGAMVAEPRTDAELQRIETLVRGAVGISEPRGDVISVVSMPFAVPKPFVEPTPGVWSLIEQYHRMAFAMLALLLVAFIGMKALRTLREPAADGAPAALAAAGAEGELAKGEAAGALAGAQTDPEMEQLLDEQPFEGTNNKMRDKVVASVTAHPEMAVRLARAWLREA